MDSYNVLFIGEEKTYANHMPIIFRNLANIYSEERPDVFMITKDNYGLATFSGSNYMSKISEKAVETRYDYVILQDKNSDGSSMNFVSSSINNIKSAIRNTQNTKSASAKFVNNVIYGYPSGMLLCNKGNMNNNGEYEYTHMYTGQRSLDQSAIEIKATNDTVVLTGSLLYDYICSKYNSQSLAGNFYADSNHNLYKQGDGVTGSTSPYTSPTVSYLEAEILVSAIYGYGNQSLSYPSVGSCTTNHYDYSENSNTFTDNDSHSVSSEFDSVYDTTKGNIRSYILANKKYIR